MYILTRPPMLARIGVNILLAMLLALTVSAVAADSAPETTVKAAYLGKFGLFTTWPERALESSVQICLLGDDPFGNQLDRNLARQRIQNRPIHIRRISSFDHPTGCHIIFINEPDLQRRSQLLESLRGSTALTVTDTKEGAATGIINFVIKDNRVRFDIDDAAAAQAGLVISSRLLLLALTVKPRP